MFRIFQTEDLFNVYFWIMKIVMIAFKVETMLKILDLRRIFFFLTGFSIDVTVLPDVCSQR